MCIELSFLLSLFYYSLTWYLITNLNFRIIFSDRSIIKFRANRAKTTTVPLRLIIMSGLIWQVSPRQWSTACAK